MTQSSPLFMHRGTVAEIEHGTSFQPNFDENGLIPAIVTDAVSGEVLMFAWMNAQALAHTIESRKAHFYSRSRDKLWMKGEESGNVLSVVEMRTDCDQDVIAIKATVEGSGVACHTGARSCFYRSVPLGLRPDGAIALAPVDGAGQPVVK